MTDIETLRQVWQQQEGADAVPLLMREALIAIVRKRARASRVRVTQRLRRELAIYGAMTVGAIVVLVAKAPSDWPLGIAWLLMFFGATGGVMFFKIRALQHVQLEGTLRDSLIRMIGILNGWMTSYMIVYMVVIGSSGALVLGTLARKSGLGPLWWLAAAACVLLVLWSYTSGRQYMRREFEGHRDELQRVLEDLEAV